MFIQMDVADVKNTPRGQVRVALDWQQMSWTVDNDPQQIWPKICFSKQGPFDFKDWGVIWIWDQQKHNTVIIRDSPREEADRRHGTGTARLFDPKDTTYK